MHSVRGSWLAAALAVVASAPALAQDPWSRVPKLPAACYSGQDRFQDEAGAADVALAADLERQSAVNEQIRQRHQSLDPMEQQRRMQAFLMKNPEEASKWMQQQQAMGAAAPDAVARDGERSQQLDAELDARFGEYEAALAEAYAPSDAKHSALVARVEAQGLPIDGEGTPPWAISALEAIARERDAAYQAVCARWWLPAASPFHGWLTRYEDWLVKEHVPYLRSLDEAALSQYAIMGTDASGYRSTQEIEAARLYLVRATRIFGRRDAAPRAN